MATSTTPAAADLTATIKRVMSATACLSQHDADRALAGDARYIEIVWGLAAAIAAPDWNLPYRDRSVAEAESDEWDDPGQDPYNWEAD